MTRVLVIRDLRDETGDTDFFVPAGTVAEVWEEATGGALTLRTREAGLFPVDPGEYERLDPDPANVPAALLALTTHARDLLRAARRLLDGLPRLPVSALAVSVLSQAASHASEAVHQLTPPDKRSE